ncbi:hypothetical protein FQA47_011825 [Oryzias melastigma]|uniref:PB1 domain-containing protein n=1 Tax=Oryzias melastigma TaxID=30732 RepID=A0A834CPF7_ORYME|nr:hypothetical protein FQA47_011825 [Oryzias melastigma]
MASPVVLRVIFGDESDSRKMSVASGIPATLSELHASIKTFFDLKEDFRLQYMDADFNAFINLTSVSEVRDKGTLKVILIPSSAPKEQFITLYPVDTNDTSEVYNSPGPQNPRSSIASSCTDDTLCTSTPHSSPQSQRRKETGKRQEETRLGGDQTDQGTKPSFSGKDLHPCLAAFQLLSSSKPGDVKPEDAHQLVSRRAHLDVANSARPALVCANRQCKLDFLPPRTFEFPAILQRSSALMHALPQKPNPEEVAL